LRCQLAKPFKGKDDIATRQARKAFQISFGLLRRLSAQQGQMVIARLLARHTHQARATWAWWGQRAAITGRTAALRIVTGLTAFKVFAKREFRVTKP
jgi:hypothetical protein